MKLECAVPWKIDSRVWREGTLLRKNDTEPLEAVKSPEHSPARESQKRASLTALWTGLLGFCEGLQIRPPPTLIVGP